MALFTDRITPAVIVRDSAAVIALYVAGLYVLPRGYFLELLNGVLAAISLTVGVVYSLDIVKKFHARKMGVVLIRAGIVGGWLVTGMVALGRIYFFEFRPEVAGRTFDRTGGAQAVGYIVFAALHLIAIGMEQEKYVRHNMCLVLWSLLGGAVAVTALKAGHFWF